MTWRTQTVGTLALTLITAVALSGCTAPDDTPASATSTRLSSPDDALTVIAATDEEESSVRTSAALFDLSPVVIVAPQADPAAQNLAARAAVGLGVPLLVSDGVETATATATPGAPVDPATPAPEGLSAEFARLTASTVITVGDVGEITAAGTDSTLDIVAADATAESLGRVTGLDLQAAESDDPAGLTAAIAALATAGESTDGSAAGEANAAPADSEVPRFEHGDLVGDTAALVADDPTHLAGIATARAAGLDVALVPVDAPNPQATASVIETLAASGSTKTLAIGEAFEDETALDWKIRSARSGSQLPGGGQLLFPTHQFVALYGTPGTGSLGVLGEQDAVGAIERTRQIAASYEGLSDKTVVPMFEIIATVAAGDAGGDGNYSNELDIERLRPWIDQAAASGVYVVIDLQPGRTDFLTQAKQYQSLLELPNVGLAIDPEWRLGPDQVPLRQIGSVGAAEVNEVTSWLADLTNEKSLPPKMFVLHQFQLRMLQDRASIDTSRPELAMLIHADGQGAQPDKQATWSALHRDAPAGIAWGWKNFYDEDTPMLTPEQTMQEVSPLPDLVTYQ